MEQLCEYDELRLLLRDQSSSPTFNDRDLDLLMVRGTTVEGAVALGWLLKAGDAYTRRTSRRIGQVAESYASGGESYAFALGQYQYWARRAGVDQAAAARWVEAVPDEGTQVGDITEAIRLIQAEIDAGDLTRLW